MPIRTGRAEWRGDLPQGTGTLQSETGAVEGPYSFGSRFEEGEGTNPEELLAAAHAACFSMALSNQIAQAGYEPRVIRTSAQVHLERSENGFAIRRVHLETEADVPDLPEAELQEKARAAKEGCPVSQALAALEIDVEARLVST